MNTKHFETTVRIFCTTCKTAKQNIPISGLPTEGKLQELNV